MLCSVRGYSARGYSAGGYSFFHFTGNKPYRKNIDAYISRFNKVTNCNDIIIFILMYCNVCCLTVFTV